MALPMIGRLAPVREAIARWSVQHFKVFRACHNRTLWVDARGKTAHRTTAHSFRIQATAGCMRLKSIMTHFMNRGKDVEPDDPIETTPFSRYWKTRSRNNIDELISYAESSLRYLKRTDSASDADVRKAAISANNRQTLKPSLWSLVAPLLATADTVRWNGGYSLASDAPEHNSDDWITAASDLNIPETRSYDGVPKAVSMAYLHLEKTARRNDEPRPCHGIELAANCGVHMPDTRYQKAWNYLTDLPGVVGPTDGPAWEYVDKSEADTTSTGEANA